MTHKIDLGSTTTKSLRSRRVRLAGSLPDVSGLIGGSVTTQGRRCNKEGCRCATGEPHGPYTYVVLARSGGQSRSMYVPGDTAQAVRLGVGVNAQVRAVLEEISAINIELLARRELA